MNKLIAVDTGGQDRKLVAEVIGDLATYVTDRFQLEEELMGHLVSWFTDHIRGEDAKYVELFRDNGQ